MLHVVLAQFLVPKQKSDGCTLGSVYLALTDSVLQVIGDLVVRFLVSAVLWPYGIVRVLGAN